MRRELAKLKLGKGAAFVKSRLKYVRQKDDTWEAGFFPIPCSGGEHRRVWMGMVLSHGHDDVLAQCLFEEPPTVNDLARLLADAMKRPLAERSHRPRRLYLRAEPEWAELVPHLKQIGIEVLSQEALPKWDRTFGDLYAQVEQARAAQEAERTRGHHPGEEGRIVQDHTDNSQRPFQELVRVLEEAVRAGTTSVGLEYKGRDLVVFHNFGNTGLGVSRIPQELQQDVIKELVRRAGRSRKSKGKMRIRLLGQDYEAVVEEYDSFGESAFTLTLKERKQKRGG